jgi:hypothetical protein
MGIVAVALIALAVSVSLTIRCYMTCPFGDSWFAVDTIARGRQLSDLAWLFGQHNEHRTAIPRAFIWMDIAAFHGTGVSIFASIWLALVIHAAIVVYALERYSGFPAPLKRTLEGIFSFCIFHPNQSENLTWSFQIGFVIPFLLATLSFLAAIYYPQLRHRFLAAAGIASAPVIAACGAAGGLLIGPVVLVIAAWQRLPRRLIAGVLMTLSAGATLYFWQFHPPDPAHPPQAALADPKGIFVYILTYIGASWTRVLPHKERTIAFLSLILFGALAIRAWKQRQVPAFESFCFAECAFILVFAFVTALGRLRFGVGQAFASRYQTPALLYWAGLASVLLIQIWSSRPAKFRIAQTIVLALMIASAITFSRLWKSDVRRADSLRAACRLLIQGDDDAAAKTLYATDAGIEPGANFLRKLWGQRPARTRTPERHSPPQTAPDSPSPVPKPGT